MSQCFLFFLIFASACLSFSSFPLFLILTFSSLKNGPLNEVLGFYWEVLNGVGVDGVGVIFPFFYAFFVFLRIFSLFFFRFFFVFLRFSLLLLKDKGKQQQFTAKMGNFTPTPSAPTPCKTSRFYFFCYSQECSKNTPQSKVRNQISEIIFAL